MAYTPEDIEVIISRLKTYIKSVLGDLNPTDQNCFIYSLIVAMANLSNDNNMQIALDIIPNSFVATCKTEEALQPYANVRNVDRKLASGSEGIGIISGDVGTVIPLGTLFLANNFKYRQNSSVEIEENSIVVSEITANGKTVSVTTATAHNFASNIEVTIAGATESKFNGSYVITATRLNSFTYSISESVTTTETSGITASANVAVLNLKCQGEGEATNLDNGDALAIETPITGLNSNAYTNYAGISGGSDIEAFEDWRARVVERYQKPITYFNEPNIKKTAKSISGVTRVWVQKCTPAVGQVTIYFIRGNEDNIIPDANEVTKVKNAICELRTCKDSDSDVFVYAPTAVEVDFSLSNIVPNTPTMKDAIRASLKQLFEDSIDLATNLTLDDIKAAIKGSFDMETGKKLESYTLSNPSGDVTIGSGELPTLGTVTFL